MARPIRRNTTPGDGPARGTKTARAGGTGRTDPDRCPRLGTGSLRTWNLNTLSLSPALAVEGNRLATSVAPADSVWFTAATTTLTANDHGLLGNLDPATAVIRTWDLDTRLGSLTGAGANFMDQTAGAIWVSAPAAVVHRLDPAARAQVTWSLPVDALNFIVRGIRTLPDGSLAIALENTAGPGTIAQLNPTTDTVVFFRLPEETAPFGAAVTSDGTLYFCEFSTRRIARLDPRPAKDNLTEWQLPEGVGQPTRLIVAPDGAVWFVDQRQAGRLDPARNRLALYAKDGVQPQDLCLVPRARRPDLIGLADGEPFVDVLCATPVREAPVPVGVGTAAQTSTYVTPAPSRPHLATVQAPPAGSTVPPSDAGAITRYAAQTPALAVTEHHGALYATGIDYLESIFRLYRLAIGELQG